MENEEEKCGYIKQVVNGKVVKLYIPGSKSGQLNREAEKVKK